MQLSKISGIKAARFMIEKYPQAFMKDDCVPHVSVRYAYIINCQRKYFLMLKYKDERYWNKV